MKTLLKALLMHPDRDFDPEQPLPWNTQALTQDLELETLLRAMAGGDKFLFEVARRAVLCGPRNDLPSIHHRQAVLKDALRNPAIVRTLYSLSVETIERKRKSWFGIFSDYPAAILHESVVLMQLFMEMLLKLRALAEKHADRFESAGFKALFATLRNELNDEYLVSIEQHLKELKFQRGTLLSAELGTANEGVNYVLRKSISKPPNWLERLIGRGQPAYTFHIAGRDEAGARALGELRDRGINAAANAMRQSADHVLSFFTTLRTELAFYVACLNLDEELARRGAPRVFPEAAPPETRKLRLEELYDVCLSLTMGHQIVGNSLRADASLTVVTGANQGGKSSFLRSVGLAQLMMQSGLFVGARRFEAPVCTGVFTHYKREEDAEMRSGKFDEEMARMSAIVDHLTPNAVVLFNESFAATNEREGSEIAQQIVGALLQRDIRVVFVTHLFTFAHGAYDAQREQAVFLRAERRPDGTRPFRLVEAAPLETSYGEDLYREVFAGEMEEMTTPRAAKSNNAIQAAE